VLQFDNSKSGSYNIYLMWDGGNDQISSSLLPVGFALADVYYAEPHSDMALVLSVT
jgi:hypothetical protein